MDDIAQTTLLNILFHGEFATMMPVQQFFGGAMTVIRPLCEIRESEIARLASRLHLPAAPNRCPNVHSNTRIVMKEILRIAARVNRHAVSNVYSSPWRINQDYLPAETRETAGEPDSTDGVLPSDWL
jgi:tRNA 2-thiocytidine biosynthesis protein TtcA